MNKIILITLFALNGILGSCQKEKTNQPSNYGNGPRTNVSSAMQGNWMYGNFSMTEYWSQNPSEYIGNGFEMAIAFKFYANGNYEQYFTSKTVNAGIDLAHRTFRFRSVLLLNNAANAAKVVANNAAVAGRII